MNARKTASLLIVVALAATLPVSILAGPGSTEAEAELEAEATYPRLAAPSTAPQAPVVVPGDVVYFSDFEANNGGLAPTLDWTWAFYAWNGATCDSSNYPPPTAYSGDHMWGTRLNTCYQNLGNNAGYSGCSNTNPSDDSILTLAVDLTGYTGATLSWWEWYDLFSYWDWAEVYANGSVIFQHCEPSFVIPTAWVQQVVDLTPFVGGPVTLQFHMMASTVVNHAGWFIDDLSVTATGGADVPLHLNRLDVTWRYVQPPKVKVLAQMRVHDDAHFPVEGAQVYGQWTYPDGTVEPAAGLYPTDALGRTKAAVKDPRLGLYQFCITDVVATGYLYTPANNEDPACETVAVGP